MRPSRAAVTASSNVVRPRSVKIRLAVLGPTPGIRVNGTTPGGVRASSFASAPIVPVCRSSETLSAIVRPTFGSSVSRPSSDRRMTDSPVSRRVLAARR